jgi:hypothetical protein
MLRLLLRLLLLRPVRLLVLLPVGLQRGLLDW